MLYLRLPGSIHSYLLDSLNYHISQSLVEKYPEVKYMYLDKCWLQIIRCDDDYSNRQTLASQFIAEREVTLVKVVDYGIKFKVYKWAIPIHSLPQTF
jgi:hypothetical protein